MATRRKKLKRKEKGRAQKIVAVALIRDRRGRILVQRRMAGKFPTAGGKWEFPGGKIEFGEVPVMALVREVAEEVGCVISVQRLLEVHSCIRERSDGTSVHAVVICYEARHVSGKPVSEKGKSSEVRWCTEREIEDLDRLDGIPTFLAASVRQRLMR